MDVQLSMPTKGGHLWGGPCDGYCFGVFPDGSVRVGTHWGPGTDEIGKMCDEALGASNKLEPKSLGEDDLGNLFVLTEGGATFRYRRKLADEMTFEFVSLQVA